jgi:hypothetical protein
MGDEDRQRLGFSNETFTARVLAEAGEKVPDQVIARWTEDQRQDAEVWADAILVGIARAKPWEKKR